MPDFSQAALWAVLDDAAVPFRDPVGDLVTRYGTRHAVWTDAFTYCDLPEGKAFLPDLAHGFSCRIASHVDVTRAPVTLEGDVRTSDTAETNYALVLDRLTGLWGPPGTVETNNALTSIWADGYCTVTVRVFPPQLNTFMGNNDRHRLVPGSATECTINIRPDWWPPLSQQEQNWIAAWRADATFPLPHPAAFWDTTSRPLPKSHRPPAPGQGFLPDASVYVYVTDQMRAVFVERANVRHIRHDILTPARGGGGSEVSISYVPSGRADGRISSLSVLSGRYDDPTHPGIANQLAARFGVSVRSSTQPDA